jgi:hypothetical protein
MTLEEAEIFQLSDENWCIKAFEAQLGCTDMLNYANYLQVV